MGDLVVCGKEYVPQLGLPDPTSDLFWHAAGLGPSRMRTEGTAPVTIRHLSDLGDRRSQMAADVVAGLSAMPKSLPSKYFYDAHGSRLFEDITNLPEYYLTTAETEILRSTALEVVKGVRPEEIIELGSGSSTKTRLLIEAMRTVGSGARYEIGRASCRERV